MILSTDNPDILNSVKLLFRNENPTDFWDSLTTFQKEEILEGIQEIENGESIDYEDFMKKYR